MITAAFSFCQFDSGLLPHIRAHIGELRPREYPWGAEILDSTGGLPPPVHWFVPIMSLGKSDETIKMPFGMLTQVAQETMLDGAHILTRDGAI